MSLWSRSRSLDTMRGKLSCAIDYRRRAVSRTGAALEHAFAEIQFDRAFVCSCDVPFVNGDLARKLCDMLGDDDALIPHVDGKLQMLHAVYRKDCAKTLATMRTHGESRLHEIVNLAKARIVPEEEIRALDPDC